MDAAKKGKKTAFIVSDSSGALAWHALKAILELFGGVEVIRRRYVQVRSIKRIHDIVEEAKCEGACIVYTFANPDHREAMRHQTVQHAVPSVDMSGELITCLSDWLDLAPSREPPHNDDPHFLEALDFFDQCEDGQRPDLIPEADVVVVGPSRTKKTPTCRHLASEGVRVANVPITLETEPPSQLFEVAAERIFVLTMRPARLREYRLKRRDQLGIMEDDGYLDMRRIRDECEKVARLARTNGWRLIDVTSTGPEEVAGQISELMGELLKVRN